MIALAAVLLLGAPAIAAVFEADILVQETAATSYNQTGIRVPANVSWWATNGYIDADGRDTRVYLGATEKPHMLQDSYVLFSDSVTAGSSNTYQLATGETAQDFYIVPGRGGYVTTLDDPAMEGGTNFEMSIVDGYFDPDVAGDLIMKTDSIYVQGDGAGNINAGLDHQPDNYVGSDDGLVSLNNGGIVRAGERINNFPASTRINWIEWKLVIQGAPVGTAYVRVRQVSDDAILGTIGSIDVSTIGGALAWYTFDTGTAFNPIQQDIRITFEYDGGDGANRPRMSVDTTAPTYANGVLTSYTVAGGWADNAAQDMNFRCYYALEVTAAGILVGERDIDITADGADWKIWVDGVERDSATIGVETMQDNGNSWVFMSNIAPYWGEYNHYVPYSPAATRVVHYKPNDIIAGTVLPDLEGAAQNGAFTFGTNPAGLLVSMGPFDIVDQPSAAGLMITTPDAGDIVTAPDSLILEDSEMTMAGNEFYFFVSWLSGVSGIDDMMLWWWLGAALSIPGLAIALRFTKNVWIAGFAAAGVLWFIVSMGGMEWWVPVPVVLATIFVGLWKRSSEV